MDKHKIWETNVIKNNKRLGIGNITNTGWSDIKLSLNKMH